MALPELALLDISDVQLLLLGWPKIAPQYKTGDRYDLMTGWAAAAGVELEAALQWYGPLHDAGMVRDDGTIHEDVRDYMAGRARLRLRTVAGADPSAAAVEYLRGMPLAERIAWLEEVGLLSDEGDNSGTADTDPDEL